MIAPCVGRNADAEAKNRKSTLENRLFLSKNGLFYLNHRNSRLKTELFRLSLEGVHLN